jgi:hypothetical protein
MARRNIVRGGCQIAVAKRGVLAIVPPDPDRGNATSLLRTTGTGRRPEMATGRAGQSPGKRICGEVAEWSKAHAWKVCRRGTVSRVRIPLSPPYTAPLISHGCQTPGLGLYPIMYPGLPCIAQSAIMAIDLNVEFRTTSNRFSAARAKYTESYRRILLRFMVEAMGCRSSRCWLQET